MFIEATEILRCPRPHDESYIICAPVTMDGRDVVRGALMCPVCRAEYPVVDRVAWFAPPAAGASSAPRTPHPAPLTAEATQTFLDLQGSGGYVLLVGSAGRLADALSPLLRTAIVCVNPPSRSATGAPITVLHSPVALPIRSHSVRAVVVGADAAAEPWLGASVAALLPGLRMIVEDEGAAPVGIVELARGAGVMVGEKR